jgi:N-acetylmuramoyl-L-alanine amidase
VEVLIAIDARVDENLPASAASSFYFGREGWHSQAGRRLAELIQEELAREGLADRGAHPKSLSLLRETQMPAVHVEPCFVPEAAEELLMAEGTITRRIAVAVATAVERFFAGSPAVAPSAPDPALPRHEGP